MSQYHRFPILSLHILIEHSCIFIMLGAFPNAMNANNPANVKSHTPGLPYHLHSKTDKHAILRFGEPAARRRCAEAPLQIHRLSLYRKVPTDSRQYRRQL